jgi:hypothetical protein
MIFVKEAGDIHENKAATRTTDSTIQSLSIFFEADEIPLPVCNCLFGQRF